MGLFGIFGKEKREKYEFFSKIDVSKLYTGISAEEIEEYSQEFKRIFGLDLPEDIKNFLKRSNGIYLDGKRFFSKFNEDVQAKSPRATKATTDLIAYNENYRAMTNINDYIILGKDDLSYFVYNIENQKYQVLSSQLLSVMKEYDDFNTMENDIVMNQIYE